MKKLKLNLDELKVESFETGGFLQVGKGTVRANSPYTYPTCDPGRCTDIGTCASPCSGDQTCNFVCTLTCPPPSADNTACIASCVYECYPTQPGFC